MARSPSEFTISSSSEAHSFMSSESFQTEQVLVLPEPHLLTPLRVSTEAFLIFHFELSACLQELSLAPTTAFSISDKPPEVAGFGRIR